MVKKWFEAFFAVAFLLFNCGLVLGAEAEQKGGAGNVLVEMKGGSITMEELQQKINSISEQSGANLDLSKGKEPILNEMIRTKLFALEARREKMDEKREIAAEIKDAVENILASNYLREQILEKIRITDDDIKAYVEKNPELLKSPESVGVRRILIRVRKDATQETLEAARKQAEEILAKVKAGEDFAKLEADSGGKKVKKREKPGVNLVYVRKGEMGKEFDDIVFGLKIGEVSPVLRTREGFVIMKVEERRPAGNLTLKDVRHYVTSLLMAEKESTAREALTKELMEKYGVKIHKELLQ